MAIMAMDTQIKSVLAFFLMSSLSITCNAGDWQFTPAVTLEETYSDNLELTQTNEISGVVTQPGLDLTASYKAQNASLNFKSSSSYAFYSHDHDLDTDYHTLSADGKILLWPNGIAFTSRASVSYAPRNSAGNSVIDIVSGDMVQVESYQSGLEYQVSNSRFSINSNLGYQISKSEDGFGENKGSTFAFTSQNGTGARNFFWDTRAQYSAREYNNSDTKQHSVELKVGLITDIKFSPFIRFYDEDNAGTTNSNSALNTNSYGAGFRWQPIPRLQIDLSYNEPLDNTLGSSTEEQKAYVDANINWQPSTRTKIQLNHSQRFFGDSYGVNISHQNKRLTNTIAYNEQVQSFTRDNYRTVTSTFLCQNPEATSLADCFLQDGDVFAPEDSSIITINSLELIEDNDYWLNKSINWNSTLTLPRTSLSFIISRSNRQNLNTAQENLTNAASFSADRKLGASTSLNVSANYSERLFNQNTDNEQSDVYRRYKIGFNRKLNQAVNINFDIEHYNRSSNQERYNYEENRISAKISKDF
ncbi:MAG: TIGR03016 family PEP-CTERM system-associated outer membrane protein [Thalassotalea sp.]